MDAVTEVDQVDPEPPQKDRQMSLKFNKHELTKMKIYQEAISSDFRTKVKIHKESKKAGGTSYECLVCGDKKSNFLNIKRHLTEHREGNPYRCKQCQVVCKSRASLTTHMKIHDPRYRKFPCTICSSRFADKTKLQNHMYVHSKVKAFPCSVCKKRYNQPGCLKAHMKIHTRTDKTFKCKICGKMFFLKSVRDGHLKTHDPPTVPCYMCHSKFLNISDLQRHMSVHTREKVFSCSICQKSFYQLGGLSYHMKTHSRTEKEFKCKTCEKMYFSKRGLELHIKTIHIGVRKILCNICGHGFNSQGVLVQHMRKHTNEKPYFCKICQKSFKQSTHMRIHDVRRSFACKLCDKIYKWQPDLKKHHMIAHSSNAKVYKCEHCDYQTKYPRYFERHGFRKHNVNTKGFRKHPCQFCPREFTGKMELYIHLMSHTGERAYACDLCHNNFTTESSLKLHQRTHSKEARFACEKCPRKFRTKVGATGHFEAVHQGVHSQSVNCYFCKRLYLSKQKYCNHLRSHTLEAPFPCTVCKIWIKTKQMLNYHMTTHTDTRFPCNLCNKVFKWKDDMKTHLRRCHSDDVKYYECQDCDYKSNNQRDLNRHLIGKHDKSTGFETHKCPFCKKRFAEKCHLSNHLKHHIGERPFSCGLCSKTFVTSTALKIHNGKHQVNCYFCRRFYRNKATYDGHLRGHTLESPYLCSVCRAGFKTSRRLDFHMTNHTNRKFSCKLCDKAYKWKDYLNTHMRLCHSDDGKYHKCAHCDYKSITQAGLTRHLISNHY